MNERIQQLADEATTIVNAVPNKSMAYSYFDTEKFAELILKECLKYIDDSFGDIDYVKFMIKRNFGVEE